MTLDQYVSMVTRVGTGKLAERRGGGGGARKHIVSNGNEQGLRAPLTSLSQDYFQDISFPKCA